MHIVSLEAVSWPLPLRAPFAIARRTALEAQNVLIRVQIEANGVMHTGWGESAPVGYITGESVQTVLTAIAAVEQEFTGQSIQGLQPLWGKTAQLLPDDRAARAGLEMALIDAWGKYWNMPLWQFFGGATTHVVSDLTIPLVTPDEAAVIAATAAEEGFCHLKIKVGASAGADADLARIASVMRAAPDARLRIDANQAFAPDEAVKFAEALVALNAPVEMIEQPVPKDDIAGLKYVRSHVDFPIFADEAARDVSDVVALLREDAVDGINIKMMKSGLAGAIQIIHLCRAAGKSLMLGCMLESGLGIAAAAQMAAGTGAFDYLDLDSHRLIAPLGGVSGGFESNGNCLSVNHAEAGWGVEISEDFMKTG